MPTVGDSRVQHVSIRVPWHDSGWGGQICAAPSANASCLALRRIHETRVDLQEDAIAGVDWDEVPTGQLPPCVREAAGFMRSREFTTTLTHPYASLGTQAHEQLSPLAVRFPSYSAPCVPFRWMLRAEAEEIAATEGCDYLTDLEDQADELIPFRSG